MSIRNRRHKQEAPELDITAFLNLMVVLIPFLLLSAVFTQVTVIELNMPPPSDDNNQQQEKDKKEKLNLEVIIRASTIEIHGGKAGLVARYEIKDGLYDMATISSKLQSLKSRFPDESNAMILLEPEINYDTLVQVMDIVRLFEIEENGGIIQAELFPDMSIGDAPALKKRK